MKYIIIKDVHNINLIVAVGEAEKPKKEMLWTELTERQLCKNLRFIKWDEKLLHVNETQDQYRFMFDTETNNTLNVRVSNIYECNSDEEALLIYECL